jgi:hypothetical protein
LGLDRQVEEFEPRAFADHRDGSTPPWDANPKATPAADSTPRNRLVRVSDADQAVFRADMSTFYSVVSTSRANCRSSAAAGLDDDAAVVCSASAFSVPAVWSPECTRPQYDFRSGQSVGGDGGDHRTSGARHDRGLVDRWAS